jgi:hypothetical protein
LICGAKIQLFLEFAAHFGQKKAKKLTFLIRKGKKHPKTCVCAVFEVNKVNAFL